MSSLQLGFLGGASGIGASCVLVEIGALRVLIPAFAVGRAQEVLLSLAAAMRAGSIPRFPVYADGMKWPERGATGGCSRGSPA